MSFITGGATELLYASLAAGTAVAAASETQINDTTLMGVQARLEPDFWLPSPGQTGKAIHVTARGILSSGSLATNVTFNVRGGAAGTGGLILLGSTANAMTASLTNVGWVIEGDIIVSTMGAAGANSTVQGYGSLLNNASSSTWPIPMVGTAATLDTSITNYISVTALFSQAGCSVTCQQLLVYGLN